MAMPAVRAPQVASVMLRIGRSGRSTNVDTATADNVTRISVNGLRNANPRRAGTVRTGSTQRRLHSLAITAAACTTTRPTSSTAQTPAPDSRKGSRCSMRATTTVTRAITPAVVPSQGWASVDDLARRLIRIVGVSRSMVGVDMVSPFLATSGRRTACVSLLVIRPAIDVPYESREVKAIEVAE